MELHGEYVLPASRRDVWKALNDPSVLQACIPGCERLERVDDNEFDASVRVKIGPVKASFAGRLQLSHVRANEGYTITGEGKSAAAGFAKGKAEVSLADSGVGATRLTYRSEAQVGGKLAQLGSRLIDTTSRKYAQDFFESFSRIVAERSQPQLVHPELVGQAPKPAGAPASASSPAAAKPAKGAAAAHAEMPPVGPGEAFEDRLEVEAGKGTFGGPWMWGILAFAVVIILLLALS